MTRIKDLWWHGDRKTKRFWLHYKTSKLSLEYSYHHSLGFSLKLGDKSSETPVDWFVGFWFVSFYGSFDFPGLGAFCAWVGQGHKRELSLQVHNKALWWNLWYHDQWGNDVYHNCEKRRKTWWWPPSWWRAKYRSWMCLRDGNIDINPLDALWGMRYYSYETTAEVDLYLEVDEFEGDSYNVHLKLQEGYRNRNMGPSWARWISFEGFSVDVRSPGIPVQNHDWKGDNVIGFSVKLPQGDIDNWVEAAYPIIVDRIKEMRRSNNYQPPAKEKL